MPSPRSTAIVVCSCGWRAGDSARAGTCEEAEEAERVLLELKVPTMIRHWDLGHQVTLQDRKFAGVVAKAASRLRDQRERGQ
jgi:hypothetical protein